VTRSRALAAAQTLPVRGDVAANLAEHVRLARVAAEAGACVLVFPELSLTGYELELAEPLAFSERDPRLGPLLECASTLEMTLVVGAPVRLGARLHVGAFIVGPERAAALYTKRHLGAFPPSASPHGVVPPPEASVFEPGDRDPLVPLGDERAAVAVCADTGRASHPERAAARGARTYLASTFVIPADFETDVERLRSHAVKHAMAVVFSNYGGPSGGLPSAGGSAIWSESGARLVQLDERGAGVAVAVEGEAGWRTSRMMLEGA